MNSTIRFRLTVWYVAASASILLAFSAGVYWLFSRALYERLDSTLRSAAQVTALSLNHELEEHGGREAGEESVRLVLHTMYQTSFPRTSIAVWDGERLVAEKIGSAGLPARNVPHTEAEASGIHTIRVDGAPYRLSFSEAPVPLIQGSYQVTVNESLNNLEAELANLRSILLIAVPFCIVLAAAGGFLLARQSLIPVSQMALTVDHISSANLEQRVPIYNPSDELGRLGETFNRLLDRLEQAFGQQQRFMADASHELRTPLSVALTAAQFTLQKPDRDPREFREALSLIQEQLRRLKRVVEDMFTLAQVDAGAYQPDIAPLYLDEIAGEAVRAAHVLARAKHIELITSLQTGEYEYEGDEGLLRQLLLILLDNAVKYTPNGGQIHLTLKPFDGGYAVEVQDTGPGIEPADQALIFDRFYRVDKARSRRDPGAGSGAGLGLSIARWIAELHGGSISLESSASGSTFRICLPYTKASCLSSI